MALFPKLTHYLHVAIALALGAAIIWMRLEGRIPLLNKRVELLQQQLISSSKLSVEAKQEASDLQLKLLALNQSSFSSKQTVAAHKIVPQHVPNTSPANVTSTATLQSPECGDWQDEFGRFTFHSSTSTIDIHQRFLVNTSVTEVSTGKVRFNVSLKEVSPSDGSVIGVLPLDPKASSTDYEIPKPRYIIGVGYVGDTSNGWRPYLLVTRQLPFHTYVGVSADSTVRLIGGFSWAIR